MQAIGIRTPSFDWTPIQSLIMPVSGCCMDAYIKLLPRYWPVPVGAVRRHTVIHNVETDVTAAKARDQPVSLPRPCSIQCVYDLYISSSIETYTQHEVI